MSIIQNFLLSATLKQGSHVFNRDLIHGLNQMVFLLKKKKKFFPPCKENSNFLFRAEISIFNENNFYFCQSNSSHMRNNPAWGLLMHGFEEKILFFFLLKFCSARTNLNKLNYSIAC